jgi:uncharacterized protein (DUF362 family)
MRKRKIETSIVGVGKNPNESIAFRQAVSFLPHQNIVNSEDTVLIIANMVNMNPPEKAVIVGQETLREVIKFFKEKNPKRIVVGAGSGGDNTLKILTTFGYDSILKEENVEFIDFNSGDYDRIAIDGKVIKETNINKIVNQATVIISFTQLKVHEEAVMSAGIKNMALYVPSAEEHGYPKKKLGIHSELHDFIYKMAINIPIDMSIISLSPAMIGTGPSKGKAVRSDFVIAGFDPVACDVIGARLLGFKPQAVGYLYKLIDIEKEFSKIAYGQEFNIDE